MSTSAMLKMTITIGMILLMALVMMPHAYGASLASTGDAIEGTTELPAEIDTPNPTFLERKAEEIRNDEEIKDKNLNEDVIGEEKKVIGEIGELYKGVRGTEDGNENDSGNVGAKEVLEEGAQKEGNETKEEIKANETEETIIAAGEGVVEKGEEKEESTRLEISEGGRAAAEEEEEEEGEEEEEEEEEEENSSVEEEKDEEEEVQGEKSLEVDSDEEVQDYDNTESVGTERKEESRATTDEGREETEIHDESRNKTDTRGHRKNKTGIKDHRRNRKDKSYRRRNHTDIRDHRRRQKDIRNFSGNYTEIRDHRRNRTDIDDHRRNQTDIKYLRRNFTDVRDHRRNFTDEREHRRNFTDINNHRRNLTDLATQREKLINLKERRRERTEAEEHRRNEARNRTQGYLGNGNGPNPIFDDSDHPQGTTRDSKAFNGTDSLDFGENSEETEGRECEGDSCEDSSEEGKDDTPDSEDSAKGKSTYDDYAEEESEVDEFAGHDDDFGETYDPHEQDHELTPGYAAHLGRKGPKRNRQVNPWPNAVIPYVVVGSDNTKIQVAKALQHIANKTCLTFKSRTDEQRYLHIKDHDGGCWTSSLGYPSSNKAVIVGLGNGCRSVGGVIHEVLHAAGFFHEHNRPDRNNFIEIKWNNIERQQRHNFRLDNRYTLTDISYDYKSVMHYGKKAFATDPSKSTLEPKNPIKGKLGGSRLSPLDVERINTFYKC